MDSSNRPNIDSKFRLVLVAASRAEQLMRGARPKIESGKRKATTLAMDEVHQKAVDWGYGPPPPKEAPAAEGEAPVAAEVH